MPIPVGIPAPGAARATRPTSPWAGHAAEGLRRWRMPVRAGSHPQAEEPRAPTGMPNGILRFRPRWQPLDMQTIRVLAVDDHQVVRAGLASMMAVESDIEVVGEAGNGIEAVEQYAALNPDVVLMDLRMPKMDGVASIEAIRRQDPRARVIVMTMYEGDVDIHRALSAGAVGYLAKDVSAKDLAAAIRAVVAGYRALPPAVARALAEFTPRVDLTPREIEVLRLVAKGLSNSEVAGALGLSSGTAKVHLQNIFRKLGTEDRTEAVTVALQRGYLHLDD